MKPPADAAIAVHGKYGSSQRIIVHCRTVAAVAWTLAEEYETKGKRVDGSAVYTAALLHDIGRTKTQTVAHGLEGSEILKTEGFPDMVVEIVRKHVGAGISADEAKRLGLPEFDYMSNKAEEVIVCFADKMVDGDKVRPFEFEVERFRLKGHDVDRLKGLKRMVEEDIGRDPEPLIFEKVKESQSGRELDGFVHLQGLQAQGPRELRKM